MNPTTTSHSELQVRSPLWAVIGTTVGPVLLISAYLVFTRWPRSSFTTFTDYVAITLSMAFGAACLLRLAWPLSGRLLALLVYLPGLWFFLGFYSLLLVCAVFHDCL